MLVNKRNLEVVNVTKVDSKIPILDCVNILEDGTSVGGNGRCFITVSPISDKARSDLTKIYTDSKCNSVNLSSSTVSEILKNIPNDRKYQGALEHADIEDTGDGKVKINLYDGARRRYINAKVNPLTYPKHDLLFRRALSNKQAIRLVLNARRLLPFLETIFKCANDTGDFCPMFIEFTTEGELIAKMINPRTGQDCIGLMLPYKGVEGKWPDISQFERRLMDGNNSSNTAVVNKPNDEPHKDSTINSVPGRANKRNSSMVHHKSSEHGNGNIQRRSRAKKTGNKTLAHIIDEICPLCGKYHLASDGAVKWCSSSRGCNYYEKIIK